MTIDRLFDPFSIKGITLKSRFVMPAMQRGWCVDGAPRPEMAEYYRARVEGGVGLVIGESCAIDHISATAQPMAARLDQETAPAWAACVSAVRDAGGEMLLQLWHEGGLRDDSDGQTLSPSGLAYAGFGRGRAAGPEDLQALREGYVRSARLAQQIGAAGIELHCAHGYLLDQFLWPITNVRRDGYGGPNIVERARFPVELLSDIRQSCGDDFLISVRISQWKEHDFSARIASDAKELAVLLGLLRAAGADMIHASARRFWEAAFPPDPGSIARWVRQLGGLPTIAVGSVGLDRDIMESFSKEDEATARIDETRRYMSQGVANGDFDLIAVGRGLIGDKQFVQKLKAGAFDTIRPFQKSDIAALEWSH